MAVHVVVRDGTQRPDLLHIDTGGAGPVDLHEDFVADRRLPDRRSTAEISPVVRPLAANEMTISSTLNSRRCRLRTIFGSKLPPDREAR